MLPAPRPPRAPCARVQSAQAAAVPVQAAVPRAVPGTDAPAAACRGRSSAPRRGLHQNQDAAALGQPQSCSQAPRQAARALGTRSRATSQGSLAPAPPRGCAREEGAGGGGCSARTRAPVPPCPRALVPRALVPVLRAAAQSVAAGCTWCLGGRAGSWEPALFTLRAGTAAGCRAPQAAAGESRDTWRRDRLLQGLARGSPTAPGPRAPRGHMDGGSEPLPTEPLRRGAAGAPT